MVLTLIYIGLWGFLSYDNSVLFWFAIFFMIYLFYIQREGKDLIINN